MKVVLKTLMFFVVMGVCGVAPASSEDRGERLPAASEIIERALEASKWAKENRLEANLECRYLSVREELGKDRDVKSREEELYKVYPVAGEPYYEKVKVDGRPLTDKEIGKEQKRKREFIQEVEDAKKGDKKKKDDNKFEFNEELISRYRSEVVGQERIEGRSVYVLRFEPKSDDLPVRRRMDHALNKSRGKLWIDAQDYGVARVEFELMEPVRIWAGLLGKVSEVEGRLDNARVRKGFWFPETMDLYMKGRVLFHSFHTQRKLQWRGCELPPELASQTANRSVSAAHPATDGAESP